MYHFEYYNSREKDFPNLCLVFLPKTYSALDLSEKKLEYTSQFGVHIVIFQQLPLYIRKRVLQEGKILFCRDDDALYEVAFRTIRELADFEPTYLLYLKAVAHAG